MYGYPWPVGTRVTLWMEGATPQLHVRTEAHARFEGVRADLIALRDRLSAEIARGPSAWPHAPRRQ